MKRLLLATTAAVALAAPSTAAFAGSVLQPGATIGIPVGAPLAEGIYFINTSSYGVRSATQSGFGVNLTSVLWATPFSFYDTRLQFFFLEPTKYTTGTSRDVFFLDSTLFAAQLAHKFDNGFNASYFAGIRTPQPSTGAFRQASFEHRGAVTYNANGFNLTANAINGIFFERAPLYSDWFNLDLTATKKIDKLELGVVAFGSTDISRPTATYLRQRQIAVGGLVGYNFGSFSMQAMVTRDVYQRNYPGYDTRGWVRLFLPLYKAPTAPEPIRARF